MQVGGLGVGAARQTCVGDPDRGDARRGKDRRILTPVCLKRRPRAVDLEPVELDDQALGREVRVDLVAGDPGVHQRLRQTVFGDEPLKRILQLGAGRAESARDQRRNRPAPG